MSAENKMKVKNKISVSSILSVLFFAGLFFLPKVVTGYYLHSVIIILMYATLDPLGTGWVVLLGRFLWHTQFFSDLAPT